MQLTGTNRSIGLIALIFSVHRHMRIVSSEWRMENFYSLLANGYSPERRALAACFIFLSFAGLVVLAKSLNPIPSRTRPLNSSAPMVLWLKPWESRSLPGLPRTRTPPLSMFEYENAASGNGGGVFVCARDKPACLHLSVMICVQRVRRPATALGSAPVTARDAPRSHSVEYRPA